MEGKEQTSIDFSKVADTDAGVEVLRWLMTQCGFHRASTVLGPNGEINPLSTVYNEARRNIWLETRKLIPPQLLAKIESNVTEGNVWATTDKADKERKEPLTPEQREQELLPSHRIAERQQLRLFQDQQWITDQQEASRFQILNPLAEPTME